MTGRKRGRTRPHEVVHAREHGHLIRIALKHDRRGVHLAAHMLVSSGLGLGFNIRFARGSAQLGQAPSKDVYETGAYQEVRIGSGGCSAVHLGHIQRRYLHMVTAALLDSSVIMA